MLFGLYYVKFRGWILTQNNDITWVLSNLVDYKISKVIKRGCLVYLSSKWVYRSILSDYVQEQKNIYMGLKIDPKTRAIWKWIGNY